MNRSKNNANLDENNTKVPAISTVTRSLNFMSSRSSKIAKSRKSYRN